MGTNFYCKHIPTEEEYNKMQEALTNQQLDKLEELLNEAKKEYHIGKRSYGWQFLFAPHIKLRVGFENSGKAVSPWENTLASLKEYLSRPDVEIYDEYGRKFTPDEFWNEEVGESLYNDPEHYINGEQYYEKYPEEKRYSFLSDTEFTTEEGLRFSTDEDFC
jgi:hypothetical protein